MKNDDESLSRFLDAQAKVYPSVIAELTAGQKRSHWMWFIFPQLRGLGSSPTSQHYGIRSREEASNYLEHPILGARLLECTELVLGHQGHTARDIFSAPDDLKFHSCMTLFHFIDPAQGAFNQALDCFFQGLRVDHTVALLATV